MSAPQPLFTLVKNPQLGPVVFECLPASALFDLRPTSSTLRKVVFDYCEEDGAEVLVRWFSKKFRGEKELDHELEEQRRQQDREALAAPHDVKLENPVEDKILPSTPSLYSATPAAPMTQTTKSIAVPSEDGLRRLQQMLNLVGKGSKDRRQIFEHRVISLIHREHCDNADELALALQAEAHDRFSSASAQKRYDQESSRLVTVLLLPVPEKPLGWEPKCCWLDALWVCPLQTHSTNIAFKGINNAPFLGPLRSRFYDLSAATIQLSPTMVSFPEGFMTICANLKEAHFNNCENITHFGDRAFSDLITLTTISFDNLSAVTSIGRGVFTGCGFEHFTVFAPQRSPSGAEVFPLKNLQRIGDDFLAACPYLLTADMSAPRLQGIGSNLLARADKLTTIKGAATWSCLASIESGAFTRTYSLRSIEGGGLEVSPHLRLPISRHWREFCMPASAVTSGIPDADPVQEEFAKALARAKKRGH